MIVSNMTVSFLDKFCGSVLWDINIVWNTTNPDLTECFQKTVVLWITYGFLWLLMPLEIYYLAVQKYQYIPWTAMNVSKMVISILLIMTNIVEFVYLLVVGIEGKDVFPADLWAPTIRAITYILALTLIVAGKVRGLHSSGVLFIFWFLITLSGAITYRTHLQTVLSKDEVLDTFLFAKTAISFPLIVAQLILSAFADTVVNAVKDDENSLPLNRASFLSIAFFSWFDKLVWFGFRHQITEKDMWILYPEYCSSNVYSDFEKFWVPKYSNVRVEDNLSATRKEKSWPSMFTILWKMNHLNFYMSIILKLLADAFMFINPLILRELLDIVSNPNVPVWRGYLYTVIIFASSILQSITAHNYYFRFQTIGIKARSTVIAAIFRKALRISTAAKRSATVGEIVNLMSVDAQRIHDFWSYVCYGLTTPLTVPLALYLLWGLLGPSVLAGVAVIIIIIPINLVLTSRASNLQSALMKQKDERIKIMNEILSGMKVLKLYAWELSFNEQVNKIRTKELIILKKFLYFNSLTTFLFQLTPFLISVTTFATYVLIDERNILDAAKAFVSLSLFDLIRYPLTYVPLIISNTIQAMISIGRVNNFMSKPELNMEQVKEPTPDEDPVIIQDGFFAWCPEDEPILHDINLNVRRGSLIAVVGSVGSGKSSLISAILGEMEMRSGITKRVKSVAYVAQQAWIQNLTLCQNILFGRQMVEEKYNTVIDACALKADLEILPGGDQTEIGEKGINLSGGQKQRISLARAVYNDADLYLLDDPLSAVDSHVGKHIFEHMIGPNGLLKEKTRILVTNNLGYLPLVDSIIVMSNGTISEVGSYKDLLEAGGAFAEFIMAYLKEKEEIDEAEVAELLDFQESILSYVENPDVKGRLSVRISKALSSEEETFVEGSSPESGIRCRRYSSTRKKSISSKEGKQREPFTDKDLIVKKNARLTQKEQVESGSVEWSVYYYYFKSSGLKYCIIAFLVLIISWSGSVGSNIWLSLWSIDKPLPDGTQDIPLRDLRLGIYAGFGGVQAIFGLLSSIVLVWANIRASNVLHNDMLLNVLRSPMFFFDTTPLGRIINRFSRDIDIIDSTVPSFIRPLADSVLQIIGVIIVICMGTPMFAVVLIPLGIIYYLIQRIFISSSRQLKRLESITRSPIFSHFSETISGLSTIRAYREQRTFTDESDRCVDSNHRAFYPFLVAKRWLAIRLDLLGASVVFCAALFSVIRKDSLDPGTVGLSVSYGLSVTFVLTFLVRYWTEIESNSVSLERIREYSQTPTEAEWSKSDFRPMSTWPDEGHVKWDHYSTKYREGLDLVLRGITCNIQGGEKIGIVGRTGAGKSSLTLALFRIIEAFGGSIAIDGVDISKLGLHDLRSRLTIIPQDPVLFCGTLRMNLDPFNKYSDEEVWKVLEHSHLKKFVMTLPEGLYYKVAEGGENLSVGQRQLVCLARALLRKTKVLVLDEATAAVDLETDDLIQATIRKEFADCTVLTIAHRLNTIMDSTRIMVLSNGTVVEFDSPTVLLQNQQSMFYSMAEDAGLV